MKKNLFLERMNVLGKEYANKIIEDPENHQDAVGASLDDYMSGAEKAYDVFRDIKKEDFCKALRCIQEYQKELDKLEEILGCELFESSICESVAYIIQYLVSALANFDNDTMDDINWWLYEDVDKEWTINGETITVETPEQLYDALKTLERV